jgi:hypothetical protein
VIFVLFMKSIPFVVIPVHAISLTCAYFITI